MSRFKLLLLLQFDKHKQLKSFPTKGFFCCWIQLLLLFQLTCPCNSTSQFDPNKISIRTPNIRPDHAEQYICVSHRLPMGNLGEYIVGFNPKGSAERIHHMLLYGCEWPGYFKRDTPAAAWDCSEMMMSGAYDKLSFQKGKICEGKTQILYAWAKDAPALKLPDKVGFKIGGVDTSIHYLVLQVHYAHVQAFEQNLTLVDHSGLDLDIRLDDGRSRIDKRAGVMLLASSGYVVVGQSKHHMTCRIDEDITMHLFKFRVHTHKLGVKVSGYKIETNGYMLTDKSTKTLIGEESPQKPQMFYDVKVDNMTLRNGDRVFAECMFENNRNHYVNIGSTGDDEMCNFYIMYWTDTGELLRQDTCVNSNPTFFSTLYK